MYDIFENNLSKASLGYKIKITIFSICALAAILFIFGTIIYTFIDDRKTYLEYKKMDSSVKTCEVILTGTHEEDDTTYYDKTLRFIINNQYYTIHISEVNSSTSQRTIYYESSNVKNLIFDSQYNYVINKTKFKFDSVIAVFFTTIFVLIIIRSRKINNDIKMLNKRGKLIKNIPCTYEDGKDLEGVKCIVVKINYHSNSKGPITLTQNFYSLEKKDGFIDLLIDEYNLDNYVIRENINRISGNLESDYYKL